MLSPLMKMIALTLLFVSHLQVINAEETSATQEIARFISSPDENYQWTHLKSTLRPEGTIHELRLTSQVWKNTTWEHAVEVYEPKVIQHQSSALLFVTGGSEPSAPADPEIQRGLGLASQCGAPVVMLHQVPNQPLLGGRKEDDLISETWLRYLETGDPSWPLLFPMVKSAVRAMDMVEDFSVKILKNPIHQFLITGASKRGWTSWLTPVVDDRVIGTAPIVIDILDFKKQMSHQLDTWGSFSLQIQDYTRKGLVKRPGESESAREMRLRTMMDPFSYRNQLTLPKLLIVGTNDPYWTVDAMNLYWDQLQGQKLISQHANAGHGLEGSQQEAMRTLAVFFNLVVSKKELPKIHWETQASEESIEMQISSDLLATSAQIWHASSDDGDFRDEDWSSQPAVKSETGWTGKIQTQSTGQQAIFGEIFFSYQGEPWSLTTLVHRFESDK